MNEYCTSFGVGGGIRPSISQGVNTFILPKYSVAVEQMAERWTVESSKWCEREGLGLTALQNAIHQGSPNADSFRTLQADLDRAVAEAYGWSDLKLHHGHYQTAVGRRFGIGPSTRLDLLRRLRDLNHRRHDEEVARDVHSKARGSASKSTRSRRPNNQLSFGDA
jgi:hypothetical protein